VWKWEAPTSTPSSTVEIAWIHLQGTGDMGLGDPLWKWEAPTSTPSSTVEIAWIHLKVTWDPVWKCEAPTCTLSSTVNIAWIHLQGTEDLGLGTSCGSGKAQPARPHQRLRLRGFTSRGLGTRVEVGSPYFHALINGRDCVDSPPRDLGQGGLGARVEVGSPNYFHALINGRDGVDSAEGGEGGGDAV
jgi:hypothetical protein